MSHAVPILAAALLVPVTLSLMCFIYVLFLRGVASPLLRTMVPYFSRNVGIRDILRDLNLPRSVPKLLLTYLLAGGALSLAGQLELSGRDTTSLVFLFVSLVFVVRLFAAVGFTFFAYMFFDALAFWAIVSLLLHVLTGGLSSFVGDAAPPASDAFSLEVDFALLLLTLCVIMCTVGEVCVFALAAVMHGIDAPADTAIGRFIDAVRSEGAIEREIKGWIREAAAGGGGGPAAT